MGLSNYECLHNAAEQKTYLQLFELKPKKSTVHRRSSLQFTVGLMVISHFTSFACSHSSKQIADLIVSRCSFFSARFVWWVNDGGEPLIWIPAGVLNQAPRVARQSADTTSSRRPKAERTSRQVGRPSFRTKTRSTQQPETTVFADGRFGPKCNVRINIIYIKYAYSVKVGFCPTGPKSRSTLRRIGLHFWIKADEKLYNDFMNIATTTNHQTLYFYSTRWRSRNVLWMSICICRWALQSTSGTRLLSFIDNLRIWRQPHRMVPYISSLKKR